VMQLPQAPQKKQTGTVPEEWGHVAPKSLIVDRIKQQM